MILMKLSMLWKVPRDQFDSYAAVLSNKTNTTLQYMSNVHIGPLVVAAYRVSQHAASLHCDKEHQAFVASEMISLQASCIRILALIE